MYQAQSISGDKISLEFKDDQLIFNGQPFNWSLNQKEKNTFLIIKNNRSFKAEILEIDYQTKTASIKIDKSIYEVNLKDKMDLLLEQMGIDNSESSAMNDLKAPMPGLILDILVSPGQEVKKGDQLLVLEAMKMENALKASGDGTINSVEVSKGDSVEKGEILIKF